MITVLHKWIEACHFISSHIRRDPGRYEITDNVVFILPYLHGIAEVGPGLYRKVLSVRAVVTITLRGRNKFPRSSFFLQFFLTVTPFV